MEKQSPMKCQMAKRSKQPTFGDKHRRSLPFQHEDPLVLRLAHTAKPQWSQCLPYLYNTALSVQSPIRKFRYDICKKGVLCKHTAHLIESNLPTMGSYGHRHVMTCLFMAQLHCHGFGLFTALGHSFCKHVQENAGNHGLYCLYPDFFKRVSCQISHDFRFWDLEHQTINGLVLGTFYRTYFRLVTRP